jgi:hypothetical protein
VVEEPRSFYLWDRKGAGAPVTSWSYEPMPEEALSKLRVGDAVRLLLMGEARENFEGVEWEKIYFEITSIDYYAKGSTGKARKFRGRAMDTYRILTPDRFVSAGDEIAFQRRNIIEVPGWHLDSFGMVKGAVAQQSNLAAVEEERRHIDDEEYAAYKRECEKKKRAGKER